MMAKIDFQKELAAIVDEDTGKTLKRRKIKNNQLLSNSELADIKKRLSGEKLAHVLRIGRSVASIQKGAKSAKTGAKQAKKSKSFLYNLFHHGQA